MASLTERVMLFQDTGVGSRELINDILLRVYRYPSMRRGFDEDDCGDFCLHFYPRIRHLISRFQFRGIPFEAYLATNVRFQLQSYLARKRNERRLASIRNLELLLDHRTNSRASVDGTDDSAGERSAAEVDADIEAAIRSFFGVAPHHLVETERLRRHLLILVMKACMIVTDDQLRAVATLTGHDAEWMLSCAAKLRTTMTARTRRIEELRARRNRLYLRLRMLEDLLPTAADSSARLELANKIADCRLRLNATRLCLSRASRFPTHYELADTLNIPKGSIDSTLYYLRHSSPGSQDEAQ
jgi:hypothetical protein